MDLAQEVGYLKGMQEATQRELTKLNGAVSDLQSTTATKDDVAELRTELSGKIDEAVAKIQGGSGTHVRTKDASIWVTILKSPITPMLVCFIILVAMFLITVSALTGRTANSLVPSTGSTSAAP